MLTVHHTRAHAALTGSVASFRSYESQGTNEATGTGSVPKLSRVYTCVRDVLVLVVLVGGLD